MVKVCFSRFFIFQPKWVTRKSLENFCLLKFIYSEKATKFCEIFPLLLTVCTVVRSKGKISQNFVAFSEYMNFIKTFNIVVSGHILRHHQILIKIFVHCKLCVYYKSSIHSECWIADTTILAKNLKIGYTHFWNSTFVYFQFHIIFT